MKARKKVNNVIRYPQSAVIPFQIKKNHLRILLVTSIKKQQWIFPKGIIEDDMTAQQSALQEAGEEAGVEGEVLNIVLGSYSYTKWGGTCEVKVFPMFVTKVLDDWPESDLRKRKWVSIEKAVNLVNKKELKYLLNNFEQKKAKIISTIM
jgi:8-oxo-dGTP pyrophosphatase MutT (NUDIX family)